MMDSQVERLWNTGGLAPVVRQKKLLDPLEVESWAMELWKKDMWKSALEEVLGFFNMGTWMRGMTVGVWFVAIFKEKSMPWIGWGTIFFWGGGMMCWILPGNPPRMLTKTLDLPFSPRMLARDKWRFVTKCPKILKMFHVILVVTLTGAAGIDPRWSKVYPLNLTYIFTHCPWNLGGAVRFFGEGVEFNRQNSSWGPDEELRGIFLRLS